MSDEKATSFGSEAAAYEQGRPEYPAAAVEWMLEAIPTRGARVADVGAGTGKLTRVIARSLASTDAEIIAVDPDADMLAELARRVPGTPTHEGSAEALPLPDATLDAVVLGQAWHWVDVSAASAEIGRVLKAGGVLGLVWNLRDDGVAWVRRLTEIMHASPAEGLFEGEGPQIAEPFAHLEERSWSWVRPMTRALLHRMAESRSYVITAAPEEKARIRSEMDALFDELGLGEDDQIDLPYVTRAFRAVRPG